MGKSYRDIQDLKNIMKKTLEDKEVDKKKIKKEMDKFVNN